MATINIGSLSFTHKGDYASGTTYAKNDIVYYSTNGNAYIAKQATTGNAPTSTAHWDVFAAGSGGIWNAGLSLGSAGQVVKVNSGANALEFGDVSVGALSIKQVYKTNLPLETHAGNTNTAYNFGTPLQITPAASTDQFDIRLQTVVEGNQGSYYGLGIGVNTSDSWGTTTGHSTIKQSTGEFGYGMGSGNDSERYQTLYLGGLYTMSDLSMSASTLYYVTPYMLVHSPAGQIKTGQTPTNIVGNVNRFEIIRYGV